MQTWSEVQSLVVARFGGREVGALGVVVGSSGPWPGERLMARVTSRSARFVEVAVLVDHMQRLPRQTAYERASNLRFGSLAVLKEEWLILRGNTPVMAIDENALHALFTWLVEGARHLRGADQVQVHPPAQVRQVQRAT